MGQYDAYLICKNGHGVNAAYYRSPSFNKIFCTSCGSKTLHQCPNCNKDIKGEYHVEGVISFLKPPPIPNSCDNCGKDFPWKSKKAQIKNNVKSNSKDDILLLETIMDK